VRLTRESLVQPRSPDIDEVLRDPDQAFCGGNPASCIMPRFVDRLGERHCIRAGHALAKIDQGAHLRLFDVDL